VLQSITETSPGSAFVEWQAHLQSRTKNPKQQNTKWSLSIKTLAEESRNNLCYICVTRKPSEHN